MTKKFKRITALAVAAVTAGTISAAAYAEEPNNFNFFIYGHGQSEYSDPVTKGSFDNVAAVNCTSGIVSETAFMFLSVYNDSDSAVTDTKMVTEVDYYLLPYTAAAAKGKNYRLKGQIGYYDAKLGGTWAP